MGAAPREIGLYQLDGINLEATETVLAMLKDDCAQS
jgi:hypothetical protein